MSKTRLKENLDESIAPGDDFYYYANGGWLSKTTIPADRSMWGSFHELVKETDEKVQQTLINELKESGPAKNLAAKLFESGMDLPTIEKQRLNAVSNALDETIKLTSTTQLKEYLEKRSTEGFDFLFAYSVHPDLADSKRYAIYLEPANLGLPERDFYLDDDEKARAILDGYKKYITDLLTSERGLTSKEAKHWAEEIIGFEKMLATNMMAKEDRRQIEKIYNPFATKQLFEDIPNVALDTIVQKTESDKIDQIIVTDTNYLQFIKRNYDSFEISLLKRYFEFLLITQIAPYAHESLETRHFEFMAKQLSGVEQKLPRHERVIATVNHHLGEALGSLFVSKHFPSKAKDAAEEMVRDIIAAFSERIRRLTWMNETTKQVAIEKLESIRVKIGYPEKWKQYKGLLVGGSGEEKSYLDNVLSAIQWKRTDDLQKAGKEVDKEEWFMPPQMVNAYYNPMFNEIVFPAAILQPPFFNWEADAALNYGGIGAVIGHEMTHGFDDQGSKFDKEGNFNEWWLPEDKEKFDALTAQLVEQYDDYKPFEDLSINGTYTLGENIADLGGLCLAYDALQIYFKRNLRPEKIDGLSAEQRFFISWATVWRIKTRPEALRTQIKTDPHPPGEYRAVGPPSNMKSFYEAFPMDEKSRWYRKEESRITIW